MYVIVAYDVDVKRVNKIKNFLRMHILHVQNSLFEGEVSPARLISIRSGIKNIIKEEDSVIIYILSSKKLLKKETIGRDKTPLKEEGII